MSPLSSLGFSGGSSGSGIIASGGTVYSYANGRYKVHKFTSSGNFVVTANPNLYAFEVVIVGGGGSGGNGGNTAGGYYRWSGAGGASGSFKIGSHFFQTGTTVDIVVGGQTGDSSITYDGVTTTAYGGPSGTSNYPNNNYAPMPAIGIPQSGASDQNPYTNQMSLNVPGHGGRVQAGANGLQGEAFNHQACFATGDYSGFGGVGAKGYDGFFNSPGLYNSGNGGYGGQSWGQSGGNASGIGCGGGGGAALLSSGNTSGGSGSAGAVWIMYRA